MKQLIISDYPMIREQMPDSDNKQAHSSLIELLAHWQSGGAGSVSQTDIQRLEQLVDSSVLNPLWARISSNHPDPSADIAVKLLLIELFNTAEPVPPWDSLSISKQKRRLEQIESAAKRLELLLADSPIRFLSEDAIRRMGLEISSLNSGPDFRRVSTSDFPTILDDVSKHAEALRGARSILRRPSHEDAHRRYFVIRIAGFLRREAGMRSNKVIAELARIMLADPEIDVEVVRKTLG
jgi:hypothetical protein